MSDTQTDQKSPPAEHKSFWVTLPGVLTAVGGLIAAVATLVTALVSAGILGQPKPTPVPTPVPTPAPVASLMPMVASGGALQLPSPVAATPVLPATSPAPAQIVTLAAPSVVPSPTSSVLLEDDFSSARHGWLSETSVQSEKGYENGEFRMSVYEADFSTWSYPAPFHDFTDIALEVDARRVEGPMDNEFGVLLRYQADTDGFYLFAISSDGFYSIQKYQDEDWVMLVEWTKSPAIRGGEDVNRLRVTAQGPDLRFYANGELLGRVEDATFRSGDVGLLATARDKAGVVVAFDNLRVRALTAP